MVIIDNSSISVDLLNTVLMYITQRLSIREQNPDIETIQIVYQN